jgi:uncharacterized cupredoxin-like copper-binding protein
MKTKNLFLVLLVFVGMSLLTACGGPAKVNVTLETYLLTISTNSVPAGKVTFHVTNIATDQMHEFVIFKTDLPEDQLPLTKDGNVDENGPGVTHIDEIADMAPGTTQDLTVDMAPGNYVLICNMTENATHYMRGMLVSFTVK